MRGFWSSERQNSKVKIDQSLKSKIVKVKFDKSFPSNYEALKNHSNGKQRTIIKNQLMNQSKKHLKLNKNKAL